MVFGLAWHSLGYLEDLERNPFAIALELLPSEDVPFPGIVVASSRALNYFGYLERNARLINREALGDEGEGICIT